MGPVLGSGGAAAGEADGVDFLDEEEEDGLLVRLAMPLRLGGILVFLVRFRRL